MLAKAQSALKKRKRAEEDGKDMDMDGSEEGEGEWMDVDEEDSTPKKRTKSNTGSAVVNKGKREPRSNRQLAGLRDDAVSARYCFHASSTDISSKLIASIEGCQAAQFGAARKEHACEGWRGRSCYQSQNGIFRPLLPDVNRSDGNFLTAKTLVRWQAEDG